MTDRKNALRAARNRRAACALSSAAVVAALWSIDPASGAVNSFFPGVTITVGADFNDPANWSLGHVPNDPTEEIVIPNGGQVNGAVSMTFNGGNIVAATLTHQGSSGRVLTNQSATPATLTLAGIAGKPTIFNNTTAFQLTIGTDTVNQLNLQLVSTNNVFQNNANNILRIFANIQETNPHTNLTINAPNSAGTIGIILGGNNNLTGALELRAPLISINFSGGTALGSGSLILDSGTVSALASQTATPTNTVLNQTTFNAGSTQFLFSAGAQSQQSVIDLGTITRSQGAAVNFGPNQNTGTLPNFRANNSVNSGILGGWATTQLNLPNNFQYDWVMVDANRNLVPFTAYNTKNDLSTWADSDNINIDNAAAIANATPTVAINSLRTSAAGVYTISFGGATTINSGGILIQGNIGSTVTFAGAGPVTSGTTDLMITLAGNTAPGVKQLTISTPIVDRVDEGGIHPVGITKSHTGTLIILGSHTYSGDVYINQGSLNIDTLGNTGDPSSLGTNGTIYVGSEGASGTLNFGVGGSTVLVGNTTSNRNFVFGDAGASLRNLGTVSLSGSISGSAFTKFGVGGWMTVSGSKTYTGPLVIGAGTLDVDVIANTGQPSGLGTGANSATITLGNQNAACLNYSGMVDATTNRPIAVSAAGQIIRVENGATPVNLTLTGALTGTFDLTKNGSGTLTISGSKTYGGSITIGKGDLSIDNAGGVGTGAAANSSTITIGNSNTATLTFTGTSGTISRPLIIKPQVGVTPTQFGGIETTVGTLTLTGGIETNSRALAFDGAGTTNVSSAIVGAGSITKNGSGTLILNTGNNYTKGTFINAGTVVISDDTSLGNASGNVSIGGGAVLLNAGNLTSGRAVTLTAGGGVFNTNGFSASFSGAVTGAGNLTKMGAGTLNLSGSNSYTGNTLVQGGTLALSGANAWAPALSGPGFTNITAGRMVLDYSGGGSSPAPTVQSLLTTSFASGFATGQLRSTTADAHHGLGWADNGSTVSVAYTYFGDANLDGVVDTSDFTALGLDFGNTTGTWQTGDFNYDGKVNALDFNAIATNFGSTAITAPTLGSLVPEPTTIALAGMLVALARRRRR